MNKVEQPQLEELLTQVFQNQYGPFVVGRFVIQPIYYDEDDNDTIWYDIESMENEFKNLLDEMERHNDTSGFKWEDEEE